MATTYELIKGETLASSAASYTFSAIPSTWTDLVLKGSAQATGSGYDFDNITVTFNGSSATSQSNTRLVGSGSAASSNRGSDQGVLMPNVMPKGIVAGNPWASIELYIPNYAGSTNKPSSAFGVGEANQTTAYMSTLAGLFSSAAAITSIVLTGSANFAAGSSFYLYGVKNA